MLTSGDIQGSLIEKIKNRTAVVGVIGLGYVGIPFAVEKSKMGFRVIGIDENKKQPYHPIQLEKYGLTLTYHKEPH